MPIITVNMEERLKLHNELNIIKEKIFNLNLKSRRLQNTVNINEISRLNKEQDAILNKIFQSHLNDSL